MRSGSEQRFGGRQPWNIRRRRRSVALQFDELLLEEQFRQWPWWGSLGQQSEELCHHQKRGCSSWRNLSRNVSELYCLGQHGRILFREYWGRYIWRITDK